MGKKTKLADPRVVKVRPRLSLAVSLSNEQDVCEIKLRSSGRLLGTLLIQSTGVVYRRPSQKKSMGLVSWRALDSLMRLGLP